jgi:hypothetical protein
MHLSTHNLHSDSDTPPAGAGGASLKNFIFRKGGCVCSGVSNDPFRRPRDYFVILIENLRRGKRTLEGCCYSRDGSILRWNLGYCITVALFASLRHFLCILVLFGRLQERLSYHHRLPSSPDRMRGHRQALRLLIYYRNSAYLRNRIGAQLLP